MSADAAPTVSVIVVSYGTREMTLDCLASLAEGARGLAVELVVLDNASADGSADAIAAARPEARLVRLAENIGFARANNRAARAARGEYLLLLNPDTLVRPGAIERLVAFARAHPEAGIWGGRTVFADGRLNPTNCFRRMTPWSLFAWAVGLSAAFPRSEALNPEVYGGWPRDTERAVDIVSGCFLLIRRALWERLGGFDPDFFMYAEEADLCLRAARLGARPWVTPEAEIVHHGGASQAVRGERTVRLLTGKVTLMDRHWSGPARALGRGLYRLAVLIRLAGYGAAARLGGRARHAEAAAAWRLVWARRADWLGGYPRAPERFHAERAEAGSA